MSARRVGRVRAGRTGTAPVCPDAAGRAPRTGRCCRVGGRAAVRHPRVEAVGSGRSDPVVRGGPGGRVACGGEATRLAARPAVPGCSRSRPRPTRPPNSGSRGWWSRRSPAPYGCRPVRRRVGSPTRSCSRRGLGSATDRRGPDRHLAPPRDRRARPAARLRPSDRPDRRTQPAGRVTARPGSAAVLSVSPHRGRRTCGLCSARRAPPACR
jgi:hypothetical protein